MKIKFVVCLFLFSIIMLPPVGAMRKKGCAAYKKKDQRLYNALQANQEKAFEDLVAGSHILDQAILNMCLLEAIEKVWIGSVRILLDKGADPQAKRIFGGDGSIFYPALNMAVLHGGDEQSKQMVELLLARCEKLDLDVPLVVNQKDSMGKTPLLAAVKNGKEVTGSFLKKKGANI